MPGNLVPHGPRGSLQWVGLPRPRQQHYESPQSGTSGSRVYSRSGRRRETFLSPAVPRKAPGGDALPCPDYPRQFPEKIRFRSLSASGVRRKSRLTDQRPFCAGAPRSFPEAPQPRHAERVIRHARPPRPRAPGTRRCHRIHPGIIERTLTTQAAPGVPAESFGGSPALCECMLRWSSFYFHRG